MGERVPEGGESLAVGKADWWSSDWKSNWRSDARSSWEVCTPARSWWSSQAGQGRQDWSCQDAMWEKPKWEFRDSAEHTEAGRGRIWGRVHTKQGPLLFLVVTVTCVQVLARYLSRYICCAQTQRMRRVLTPSTHVTSVGHAKKATRLLRVSSKLKKR